MIRWISLDSWALMPFDIAGSTAGSSQNFASPLAQTTCTWIGSKPIWTLPEYSRTHVGKYSDPGILTVEHGVIDGLRASLAFQLLHRIGGALGGACPLPGRRVEDDQELDLIYLTGAGQTVVGLAGDRSTQVRCSGLFSRPDGYLCGCRMR